MSKGVQLALAIASVVVALVWILQSNEGAFVAYDSVSEMREKLALRAQEEPDAASPSLRVTGYVVTGSIDKDLEREVVRFTIQDEAPDARTTPVATSSPAPGHETLSVVYQGIDVPDLFADGAQVIVEGKLGAGAFQATRLMAKCPSKYENAPPDAKAPEWVSELDQAF